jgi:hypothetical protein
MRAKYTPRDKPTEQVGVVKFTAEAFSGHRNRSGPLGVGNPEHTLARLIDLLASRGIMTGGDVLAILGFTSGTLELVDDQ